jgi:hypothetical protein
VSFAKEVPYGFQRTTSTIAVRSDENCGKKGRRQNGERDEEEREQWGCLYLYEWASAR